MRVSGEQAKEKDVGLGKEENQEKETTEKVNRK